MRVLIVPDAHLKAWILTVAKKIMKKYGIERAVVLGDVLDDWGKQRAVILYEEMLRACIDFAKEFPDTIWLWGNHEVAYLDPYCECSGHSHFAFATVATMLHDLREALNDEIRIAARIDNVLFSHAGIAECECRAYMDDSISPVQEWDNIIDHFNNANYRSLWTNTSPLWYRPDKRMPAYSRRGCLQVAGHTPVSMAALFGNLLIVDTFSTDQKMRPLGSQLFTIVDTETCELTFVDKNAEIVSDREVAGRAW